MNYRHDLGTIEDRAKPAYDSVQVMSNGYQSLAAIPVRIIVFTHGELCIPPAAAHGH
jgi:hypothetical protein